MAILLFGEPQRLLTAGCQSQDTVTWSDNLLACITFPKPVNDGSVPKKSGLGATLFILCKQKLHLPPPLLVAM